MHGGKWRAAPHSRSPTQARARSPLPYARCLPQCTTTNCTDGFYESVPCTASNPEYAYWYFNATGTFPPEADRVCSEVSGPAPSRALRRCQHRAPAPALAAAA